MTVHMVRVLLEPPKGNAATAVDNWVQNHTEWTDDPVDHALTVTNTGIDGSGAEYVSGDYRFVQDTTATGLLDALESRLQSLQGGLWYRIGYHICDHDEPDPDGCAWDAAQTREDGNIPAAIPELA